MKKELSVLILLIVLVSCGSKNEENKEGLSQETIDNIDMTLSEVIVYSNEMNGVEIKGAERIPETTMAVLVEKFNKAYGDDELCEMWNSQGILKTDFDGDAIADYIVLTQVIPTPFMEDSYVLYGIMGKNSKVYKLESFSLFQEDYYYDETAGEAIDNTKYELLPYIMTEQVDNISTYYIQSNHLAEVYNPVYYEPESDSFEIVGYD
jgi:hypothetical protein